MKKLIFCVLLSTLLLTACTPLPIPDPTVSTTVPTTEAPETTAPPETRHETYDTRRSVQLSEWNRRRRDSSF